MSDSPQPADGTDNSTVPTSRRSWLLLLAGGALGGNGTAMATAAPADERSARRLGAADSGDDVRVFSMHTYGQGGYGNGGYGGVEIQVAVETDSASGVGASTATLRGELVSVGDTGTVDVGFEYGSGGSLDLTADAGSLDSAAEFDAEVVDLSPDTAYEFRAVATANGESVRGDVAGFETLEADQPPVCAYTDSRGVVTTTGLRTAVDDWQAGDLDTTGLSAAVSAWAAGDPVEDCR